MGTSSRPSGSVLEVMLLSEGLPTSPTAGGAAWMFRNRVHFPFGDICESDGQKTRSNFYPAPSAKEGSCGAEAGWQRAKLRSRTWSSPPPFASVSSLVKMIGVVKRECKQPGRLTQPCETAVAMASVRSYY